MPYPPTHGSGRRRQCVCGRLIKLPTSLFFSLRRSRPTPIRYEIDDAFFSRLPPIFLTCTGRLRHRGGARYVYSSSPRGDFFALEDDVDDVSVEYLRLKAEEEEKERLKALDLDERRRRMEEELFGGGDGGMEVL